ncbi:hypothetical protein D922_03221 [Enterococcus faecalis 06-MB-DW-09]|nr:hypothetical protein D922_03221 [Enterococcus faecalis 06-MB-DW-09]
MCESVNDSLITPSLARKPKRGWCFYLLLMMDCFRKEASSNPTDGWD